MALPESRADTMTNEDYMKSLRRRRRRANRLICLVLGHRYIFGVKSAYDSQIWDCRWCPHSEVRYADELEGK